jgi:predicted nucleotidyltransferase
MTAASASPIDDLERAFQRAAPRGVAAAYLFGSHSTGRAHRDSDVDIGVLLDRACFPTSESRFEERVRLTSWCIEVLHKSSIDLIAVNDVPPGLAAHVATCGVALYVANQALDHAFRRDAQLRSADLAPFLRRTRASKLASLGR